VTVRFCDRYIEKRSRTHDQMVQAARSGVQNIAEGSQAAGTSKKTELKLTNVARASLEELRLDYEDFLRQRGLSLWDRNDPRRQSLIDARCTTADGVARWCQRQRGFSGRDEAGGMSKQGGPSGQNGRAGLSGPSGLNKNARPTAQSTLSTKSSLSTASGYPELAANAALVLIAVACSLLDRQLASLAAAFEREGGFTERLYRIRKNARGPAR
jgi:four helix bundle suffix protein